MFHWIKFSRWTHQFFFDTLNMTLFPFVLFYVIKPGCPSITYILCFLFWFGFRFFSSHSIGVNRPVSLIIHRKHHKLNVQCCAVHHKPEMEYRWVFTSNIRMTQTNQTKYWMKKKKINDFTQHNQNGNEYHSLDSLRDLSHVRMVNTSKSIIYFCSIFFLFTLYSWCVNFKCSKTFGIVRAWKNDLVSSIRTRSDYSCKATETHQIIVYNTENRPHTMNSRNQNEQIFCISLRCDNIELRKGNLTKSMFSRGVFFFLLINPTESLSFGLSASHRNDFKE